MQLSGHRHEKSVNNYSSVSKEQQKNMSLILSSKPSICNAASKQQCLTHCCNHRFDGRGRGFVHKNLDVSFCRSLQWSRIPWWTIQHSYKRCEQVTRLLCRWLIFYGTKLPTNQTNSWIVGWWRQPTTSMKNFTTNYLFLKYYQSDRLNHE